MKRWKHLAALCAVCLLFVWLLPAAGASESLLNLQAEPVSAQPDARTETAEPRAAAEQQHPEKKEILNKWTEVTSASTLYVDVPSVSAPYAAGKLSDNLLQSGLTYLNYIRFVAGLPEVTLNETLNDYSQHGAVLLAAINTLTHYPSQPEDMDDAFYEKGYTATSSSNISMRYGYSSLSCLQSAVQGCMNDYSSVTNLSCVGHRRWLLNPTLGKVGFGYAQSDSGYDYIVNYVFDRSGSGCAYDFISWPVAGNHPTNLFDIRNPWSVTLNPSIYRRPSLDTLKVTITRQSDGSKWYFDSTTGTPSSYTSAYLTVNTGGYGISNCIIFHPGSTNVSEYTGKFTVDISGIYYADGTQATLSYEVDFFELSSVCEHSYESVVTPPDCYDMGYISQVCTICGNSFVSEYIDALGHSFTNYVSNADATCTRDGTVTAYCDNGCGSWRRVTDPGSALGHSFTDFVSNYDATCTRDGTMTALCDHGCGASSTITDKGSALGHVYMEGVCVHCGDRLPWGPAYPKKPYKIVNTVSGVHVYWNAVEGVSKYGLWRSETGKDGTYQWIGNPSANHFTDTNVTSGKTYYYKVSFLDTRTDSHYEKSEAIGITFVDTPDITSRFNKAAGITLGWDRIEGATGYAIYRKSYSGSDAWVRVGTVSGNDTLTWQDTSVKNANGTVYRYTIRALHGTTLSGCRSVGRTMARLSSRSLNAAVKASDTSVKCSWSTSSAVTGYEVRFMVGNTVCKTFTVGNYKTGVKSFTGLQAGQTYKIQVRAYLKVDGMGFYSAWSTARYVTL